jgi:probable O-glycosylation ligase (exosortase A-associated)
MPLRDLLVFAAVVLCLPTAFRRPYFGLLLFSWLAYMRPQDLCWGFARDMRFSFIVGAAMILGWYVNESHRRRFWIPEVRTRLMLCLMVFISLSLVFAHQYGEFTFRYYTELLKILAVAIFTVAQVDSRNRLRGLLWVICASLAFYSVKNGLIGLMTGGTTILRGPGGLLLDNNDFALAMVMNIPLLFYLGRTEKIALLQKACTVAIFLTVVTVLLTHSRGGFLAMVATFLILAWRSGKLFQATLVLGVMTIAFFLFAPEHVVDRIASIFTKGTADPSAHSRVITWQLALHMIQDNPIWGVGLRNFQAYYFTYGVPAGLVEPGSMTHVAHNSYLQIWAEGGSLAFFTYMALLGSVFWSCRYLRRIAQMRADLSWAFNYSRMLEASIVGFMVGGMFLNRGHFDLVYHFIAIVSCCVLVAEAEFLGATQGAPRPVRGQLSVRFKSPVSTAALPRWERAH